MKKRISGLSCVLLAAVLVFGLAACGNTVKLESRKYDDIASYVAGTAVVNDAGTMYFVNDGKKSKTGYEALKYLGGDRYYQAIEKASTGWIIVDKNDNKIFSPASGERFTSYEALYNQTVDLNGVSQYQFLFGFVGTLSGGNKVIISTSGSRTAAYAEVSKVSGAYYSAKKLTSQTVGLTTVIQDTYDLINVGEAKAVLSGYLPVSGTANFYPVTLKDVNFINEKTLPSGSVNYIVAVSSETGTAKYDLYKDNMDFVGAYEFIDKSDYAIIGTKHNGTSIFYDVYTVKGMTSSEIPLTIGDIDTNGYTYVGFIGGKYVLKSIFSDQTLTDVYVSIGEVKDNCYRIAIDTNNTEHYLSVFTGKKFFSKSVSESKNIIVANAVNGFTSMLVAEYISGATAYTYYSDKLSRAAPFVVETETGITLSLQLTNIKNVFRVERLDSINLRTTYAVWAPETAYDSRLLEAGEARRFTYYDTVNLFTHSPVGNFMNVNMAIFTLDGVYSLVALDNSWTGKVTAETNLFPAIESNETAFTPVRLSDVAVKSGYNGFNYNINIMQYAFRFFKSDGITIENKNVIIYNDSTRNLSTIGAFGNYVSVQIGDGTAGSLDIKGQFKVKNEKTSITDIYTLNDETEDAVLQKKLSVNAVDVSASYSKSDILIGSGFKDLEEYYYYFRSLSGKTTVYDSNGVLALPTAFTYVTDAKANNFVVSNDGILYGVAKKTGEGKYSIAVPLKYADIKLFQDGSAICLEKNSVFTLFDKNGKKTAGNIYSVQYLSPDMSKYSGYEIKVAYKLNMGDGFKCLVIG